jgi:hypothetical protein
MVPRKVFFVVAPVIAAGVFTFAWAVYRYASEAHTPREVVELIALPDDFGPLPPKKMTSAG